MATQELLSPQELEHLAVIREVTITANSPGWTHILTQMEQFVEEAHEDMFGAVYASDAVKANLQGRWQQREAMLRGIRSYIQECEQEKNQLLETTRSVPPEDYGEQDRDIA